MSTGPFGLLRFEEGYFERIWGGDRLHTLYNKPLPAGRPIGEAWLIADHATHQSVVADGPHQGQRLRQLIETDARALLGSRAELTVHGRFPLLLKILDAREILSVQVHPDNVCAQALHEPDVGKTEMWHVLHADPHSELTCGLDPAITSDEFAQAVQEGTIERCVRRFEVADGDSVFVPAGTVHAIGAGVVLAEIQQNSDLTYRIYDWNRLEPNGQPRALNLDKALKAIHFGSPHGGKAPVFDYSLHGSHCTVLAACSHFAAELVRVSGAFHRATRQETFHICLAKAGTLRFFGSNAEVSLDPGQAVLIPGRLKEFAVKGVGMFLDYYAPDLQHDILDPLNRAGHDANLLACITA